MVALSPACVHQYAVILLTAIKDFKWHAWSNRNDGTATREEAQKAISHYKEDHKISDQFNTDRVLSVNDLLGLYFKSGSRNMYTFPSLLSPIDMSVAWNKEYKNKTVYVGRRLVCRDEKTIISPSTFAKFQSNCTTLDKKARLGTNKVILSTGSTISSHVECLVVMIDFPPSVNFVCRGGKGSENRCVSELQNAMSLWKDMSGTEYQTEYLSKQHLVEHKEMKQVVTYSEKDIEEAKATGEGANAIAPQVVGDKLMIETLGDLLVILPSIGIEEVQVASPISNVVIEYGSAQWYSFGERLGFNHDEIQALTFDKVTPADKLSAIINVRAKHVDNVKKMNDLLLDACNYLSNPIVGDVKMKLGINLGHH